MQNLCRAYRPIALWFGGFDVLGIPLPGDAAIFDHKTLCAFLTREEPPP